jgi:hypothetical protein
MSLTVAMLVLALTPSDGLAAAEAPALRDTGVRVPGELFGDGERLVGVPEPAGMLVLDAATGQRGFVRSPPGCSPAGVGGGAAAFACAMTPGMAGGAGVVVDLVSGRQERLPERSLPTFGYNHAMVAGVGRRWVRVEVRGYRNAYDAFIERSTARVVIGGQQRDTAFDLDAHTPWRLMCRPLRARTGIDAAGADGAILPYVYRRPIGATVVWPTIVVERCGRARPLIARRCAGYCSPPAVAAGVVAWREGGRVRAFLPRSRRLVSWPVATGRFALTAHRVWVVKDGRLRTARV